jgi:hypothetical protein
MFFSRDEKVFSVSKTRDKIPVDDVSLLFSEFFCYLLITGLYLEGNNKNGVSWDIPNLSETDYKSDFYWNNTYNQQLGKIYLGELITRLRVLLNHPDVLDDEKRMLRQIDGIFRNDNNSYGYQLSARDILSVAYRRVFTNDMMIIAHYVAVTFGQTEFPDPKEIPSIYISLFGNLHIAHHDRILVSPPSLLYGSMVNGEKVTALWSLVSSMVDGLSNKYHPGYNLGETLKSFNFLSELPLRSTSISYPRYAAALDVDRALKLDKTQYGLIPLITTAYKEFMYGGVIYNDVNTIDVSRRILLNNILDLMMEKVGVDHKGQLFADNSNYRKLMNDSSIRLNSPKIPVILEYAIESLDSGLEALDKDVEGFEQDDTTDKKKKRKKKDDLSMLDSSKEEDETEEDPVEEPTDDSTENKDTNTDTTEEDPVIEDPQTDNNGYDPANPPPVVPAGAPSMEKNNIGLISLDKSGEGFDEDLYRRAVIALNDRLRDDDNISIKAEVKASLDQWVNSLLYRASIDATKEQISSLGLQEYLKIFK